MLARARMQFVVLATDKPECSALRERTRPEHRLYLRNPGAHQVRVLLAGPTHERSGTHMNGTLMIVEAKCIEAVSSFVDDDPYTKAGLFKHLEIRPWTCGLGAIRTELEDMGPHARA